MSKNKKSLRGTVVPSPNIENLRKRAKRLLSSLRRGDAAAWTRLEAVHELPSGRRVVKLSDAQLVLARELGYSSWPRLVAGVRDHKPEKVESPGPRDLGFRLPAVEIDAALLPGSIYSTVVDPPVIRQVQREGTRRVFLLPRKRGEASAGTIGLLAEAGPAEPDAMVVRFTCLRRVRLERIHNDGNGRFADVAEVETPPERPSWAAAAADVRELVKQYAGLMGTSANTLWELGRDSHPADLADEIAPLCTREVVAYLLGVLDPEQRLEIVRGALQQMVSLISPVANGDGAERKHSMFAAVRLVVVDETDGKLVGQHFPVREGLNLIGRALSCDICLPLESVSRQHCTISLTSNGLEVADNASTNGVFVGSASERIERTAIVDGERFRVGSVTFEVVHSGAASSGARRPRAPA